MSNEDVQIVQVHCEHIMLAYVLQCRFLNGRYVDKMLDTTATKSFEDSLKMTQPPSKSSDPKNDFIILIIL